MLTFTQRADTASSHLIVLRVAAKLFVGFTIYMKIGLKYKHALNAQVLMAYSSMVFEDKLAVEGRSAPWSCEGENKNFGAYILVTWVGDFFFFISKCPASRGSWLGVSPLCRL